MLTAESLLESKNDIDALAERLASEDISVLVGFLEEKNDEIRYASFLTLQKRSQINADVYPYFKIFFNMLSSSNSYHRGLGAMLISENVKWDSEKILDQNIKDYLSVCDDEKFITSRQAILSMKKWARLKPDLLGQIADYLISIDIPSRKDSQQKLMMMDIIGVLFEIHKHHPMESIIQYALNAARGGILDSKSVKIVEKMFFA